MARQSAPQIIYALAEAFQEISMRFREISITLSPRARPFRKLSVVNLALDRMKPGDSGCQSHLIRRITLLDYSIA